jgi:hypothetical protein
MSETLELAQQREQLPFARAHGAERKRIVIIGAGFAGMAAARALRQVRSERRAARNPSIPRMDSELQSIQ